MKDQLHIRNAEAAQLARQTGRTTSEVVLDALRQYRPSRREATPRARVEAWRRLLRNDREGGLKQPEMPVEAFYDKATGLVV